MTNVNAILNAEKEARALRHPQRLMRITMECAHLKLLPWNLTGAGIRSKTSCQICPDRPERLVVNIEETGVLSAEGAENAGRTP